MIDNSNNMEESNSISNSYICWLEEFTDKYPFFDLETFMFSHDKITDTDFNNVSRLEVLFEKIYDYAEDNCIPYQQTNFSTYYCIQNNEIGYEIGVNYSPGCNFYCKRLESFSDDAIEFQDIVNNKKESIVAFWNTELEQLTSFIERLYDEDVPIEFIENTASKAIQKIKRKKN